MFKIGIDVGGTFTDFVIARDGEEPRYFKTPSTPHDPSEAVATGLAEAASAYGLNARDLLHEVTMLIHGSTVATNTLVERKGARVGLLTTEGFRDVLEMRDGLKEDRYNLHLPPINPLVPRYLRLGVRERVRFDGSVETPLDESSLADALDRLAGEDIDSLAVCLLFSYVNPDHERRIGDAIRSRFPDLYTSLSHRVLPQIKEFDRVSTTVVNAYVGPVFGEYLKRLRERLEGTAGDRDILIMQSNGGVATLEDSRQQAVRAILSGPAGGVAGATRYGWLAGASNLIGFDMGGTSTDISLVENGEPHLAIEKFEAGWKIATPMIDIHTLGAGGGSIARVDEGGILRVGPDSAGASPGPACYGKGGEDSTVTDANVALGYLDPANFLGGRERLDPDAANEALRMGVAEPLDLTTVEAAHGVQQVINTAMAEGIRVLCARRGVDPRDFDIVAFGGAAGLHVTRVARELAIETVRIPPAAPVLSAYGMLNTDLKYDLSRSHAANLDSINLDEARAIVGELTREGVENLLGQGVPEGRITTQVFSDMRYFDQIYEVTVQAPDFSGDRETVLGEWAGNFHQRFEELFSYRQVDHEIRLVTLRVVVTGALPRTDAPPATSSARDAGAARKGTRRIYTGDWVDAPVYDSSALPPGSSINGPAVLETEFTTILLDEGDAAEVDQYGGLVLDVAPLQAAAPATDGEPDPVTLAMVERRLDSIAQEMVEVMLRTSMSQILNSSRDFSTVILDADCQMAAQGEGIPVHMSALPVAARAVVDFFGDDIHEGDLFMVNDPYFGGSHLPDITVLWPVFHEGRLRFFTVNRAHHSDVGGGTHGGYNPAASEIFHEGLRIPPLRIQDKDVPRYDLIHMMSANVRHPEGFVGDLNAQIGSVMTAARRIHSLLERYGPELLTRTVRQIMRSTETRVRGMIAGWPDGVYHGESFVDNDGFDAEQIPIRARVTIRGDAMNIDLGESSRQVTGFINSAYANTRSIAHAAIMYMAPADVPKNEGSMRPVSVEAPKGLIVNAEPPAPVCMSTNHCAEEIVEAIFLALAQAVPEAVTAGYSRRLRYAITGTDPRTDRKFIWHFFMARGGGGAANGTDGWNGVGEINVVGGIRSPSVEITEERFPLFVVRHEYRANSAGDGRWRGGYGAECEIIYQGDGEARLNMAGDGTINPPYGLFGGRPGLPHIYSIVSNGTERVLPSKLEGVAVTPGDRIVCLSSGGGGFGDPSERPEASRCKDARNGYVE